MEAVSPSMKFGGPHSCGDSRLACVDCNAQVCPACMEQCPVGNRCKKCSERFTGHITKMPLPVVARTLVGAVVVGLLFGSIEATLKGGYFIIVLFVIGLLIGKGLHKLASYKLGRKVVATILGGLLIGVMISPVRDTMLGRTGYGSAAALQAQLDAGEQTQAQFDEKALAESAQRMAMFRAVSCWLSFLGLTAGILTPILSVRVRN